MSQSAGWCTNWDAYDLPRLWQMVSGEDDDQGWAQVQAWFRLRSAVNACRERLQACRQALQDQWPPDKSPASAAFIAYIDQLTISMAQTAASAERTAHGLAGIMSALATAKAEMEPLYENWREVSNDLTPRWWDGAEDELNAKARAIMRTAEMAVADYTPMIEIPPKYDLGLRKEPVVRVGPDTSNGEDRSPGPVMSSTVARAVPPVPHDPPPPLPRFDPALPGSGPVLSGAPAPATFPMGNPASVPSTGSSAIGPSSFGGTPISPVAPVSPGAGPLSNRKSNITRSLQRNSTRIPGPGGIPMAPVVPRAGSVASQPARGAASRPANTGIPIVAPTAGANRSTSGTTPTYPTTVGGTYRTRDDHLVTLPGRARHATRWDNDLDDAWAIEIGVTPVITPPQPRPHEPGPGIIGIDR